MNEIKEGDTVVRRGVTSPTKWTVKAVRNGDLWLSAVGYRDHIEPEFTMVKVEPKFEVGKTYRHWNLHPDRGRTVTVSAVSDLGALGWWSDGKPWGVEHSYIKYWVEVTDEETAVAEALNESAEVAAESDRKLTKVMVTTYHPQNYVLLNTEDGSQWKISGDGTWVRYNPTLPSNILPY